MSDAPVSLANTLSDRYTIERLLGHGGMATVHLAEEKKHKRKARAHHTTVHRVPRFTG